jgi:LacI family transcriptional regulator
LHDNAKSTTSRGVSIRDVARRAGVSVGTVSNVLNQPDVVSPARQASVLKAIAELGFVPNASARYLRRGHGQAIGLIVLDVANPFFTDLARGVEDAANEAGLLVILCNSDEERAKERRYLEVLEQQRVQGILLTPVDGGTAQLAALRERGIRVVLLDRRAPRQEICSVSVDDRLGGRLAVAHLIEAGHRRIAFVGGPHNLRQVVDRQAGAVAALTAAGLPASALVEVHAPSLNVAGGRAAAAQLLEIPQARRPSAVFCANDLLALGMLQALNRQRVPVPDAMAIVGYDDIELAAAAAVPLSSVRQPRGQIGRTAAELLIDEVANRSHQHRRVLLRPELVIRDSSQP